MFACVKEKPHRKREFPVATIEIRSLKSSQQGVLNPCLLPNIVHSGWLFSQPLALHLTGRRVRHKILGLTRFPFKKKMKTENKKKNSFPQDEKRIFSPAPLSISLPVDSPRQSDISALLNGISVFKRGRAAFSFKQDHAFLKYLLTDKRQLSPLTVILSSFLLERKRTSLGDVSSGLLDKEALQLTRSRALNKQGQDC